MLTIRGNSGLGDAIYTRAVAEHLIARGEKLTVCTDWPDIYRGLPVSIEPFRRTKVTTHAVYTTRKKYADTKQWQDVCIQAGLGKDLPFTISWRQRNSALVDELRTKAEGRPLVLVHGGRTPWGRKDGFGKELMPLKPAFDAVLSAFRDCYTVRIGKEDNAYGLETNRDLTGKTSVTDLLDLGQACDGVIGQCSYAIPLAEAFGKPAMFVWAEAGIRSRFEYIRQVRPEKVLSRESSMFVMDNWTDIQIKEECSAFRLLR